MMAKLGKGENISTDVLPKIYKALNSDITNIIEIEQEELTEEK